MFYCTRTRFNCSNGLMTLCIAQLEKTLSKTTAIKSQTVLDIPAKNHHKLRKLIYKIFTKKSKFI